MTISFGNHKLLRTVSQKFPPAAGQKTHFLRSHFFAIFRIFRIFIFFQIRVLFFFKKYFFSAEKIKKTLPKIFHPRTKIKNTVCNELLLKLQYKSFEKETEYTGIPSVFMPASTKNEIPPPLVNIFSKIRMLHAGKSMLSLILQH